MCMVNGYINIRMKFVIRSRFFVRVVDMNPRYSIYVVELIERIVSDYATIATWL